MLAEVELTSLSIRVQKRFKRTVLAVIIACEESVIPAGVVVVARRVIAIPIIRSPITRDTGIRHVHANAEHGNPRAAVKAQAARRVGRVVECVRIIEFVAPLGESGWFRPGREVGKLCVLAVCVRRPIVEGGPTARP